MQTILSSLKVALVSTIVVSISMQSLIHNFRFRRKSQGQQFYHFHIFGILCKAPPINHNPTLVSIFSNQMIPQWTIRRGGKLLESIFCYDIWGLLFLFFIKLNRTSPSLCPNVLPSNKCLWRAWVA